MNLHKTTAITLLGAVLALVIDTAGATPLTGTVLRDASDDDLFSFYLESAELPPPIQGPQPLNANPEAYFFEEGATFDFEFVDGIITLEQPQTFFPLVRESDGDEAVLEILSLSIDTNDTDGFLSGFANVRFNGAPEDQIIFSDENIDGTPFNSSTLENGLLSVFLSGRTLGDGPQLNFAFQSQVSAPVPEPASLALFGLGALSVAAARRRRRR